MTASPPSTLRSLDAFGDFALVLCAGLSVGIGAGALTTIVLRRRGLSWGWSALALAAVPFVLLASRAGLLDSRSGAATLVALLGAYLGSAGWGIRAGLDDRRAGGDRAAANRALLGPAEFLKRRLARPKERARLGDDLPIGRTAKGELALIARGSPASGSHVLIPGSTGAGKTTTLAALLVDYVTRSQFGAVVLEAKSDATLCEAATSAAAARGSAFHLVSPDGPAAYDPLAHGSVDERAERLIAVEGWGSADADFYRQAASPFLRQVIRALDASPERTSLRAVAANCEPDALENLALAGADERATADLLALLGSLRSDQKRAIAGLQARLQNLASSDFAAWLDPEADGPDRFDLRAVIERRELAYFRFDTDRTGNVGRAIAQMVLLDLGAAASAAMGKGYGTFIAVDEFGALEAPALDRLYARGRAAGFSVALGTQTLADLRAAGPAVRERIGATVSSVLCHRIGEQADAEWVAELIGAVPAWQTTIRTDGLGMPTAEGTRTRGYRFEVNPSELQRLPRGEAVVARLDRADADRAKRARIVPPWQRLPQTNSA